MFAILKELNFQKEIKLLYLSFFSFATAVGMNLVSFPTILKLNNINPAKIGISYTIDAIGGIFISFFLAKIVARIGLMKTIRFGAIIYALLIIIIYHFINFYLWLLISFAIGVCWFIYTITRISWLNILLNNSQRGVGLGIFSMIISAGIALGPIIVSFSKADQFLTFIISASLVILSLIFLIPLNKLNKPIINSKRIPLKDFFIKNPTCFLTRFFLDFQTYILMTFTVVYGSQIGLSYEKAGLLITAYMASGFFDTIVGFMLKKISPYKLINIGFLGCLYCFIAILIYNKSYFILLLIYFSFGMFIACIYVSVFKIMNEDYNIEELVSASATFQLIGTTGSVMGSLFGGLIINIIGAQGLPISIIFSCVFYITYLIIYEKRISPKN